MIRLLFPFLFFTVCSCAQTPKNHKVDPRAVALNYDIVPLFNHYKNADSCRKALSLLDQATEIDSDYFLGYYNKLTFLYSLKEFDKALLTVKDLIRLKPEAHDLFLMQGILYERIQDSISAKPCFEKSLAIANLVLDTMQETNMDYSMFMGNKITSLIMLGDTVKADEVFARLQKSITDEEAKQAFLILGKKNKKELLEYLTNDPNSR